MRYCKDCRHWAIPTPRVRGWGGDPEPRCMKSVAVADPITGIVTQKVLAAKGKELHEVLNRNNSCPYFEDKPKDYSAIYRLLKILNGR